MMPPASDSGPRSWRLLGRREVFNHCSPRVSNAPVAESTFFSRLIRSSPGFSSRITKDGSPVAFCVTPFVPEMRSRPSWCRFGIPYNAAKPGTPFCIPRGIPTNRFFLQGAFSVVRDCLSNRCPHKRRGLERASLYIAPLSEARLYAGLLAVVKSSTRKRLP